MKISSGISPKEISDLAKRVVKLLDKEIDDVWFFCGWRNKKPCKGFKSLGEEDLRQIRSSLAGAKRKLDELLFVFPLVRFKRKLIRAESGIHFSR